MVRLSVSQFDFVLFCFGILSPSLLLVNVAIESFSDDDDDDVDDGRNMQRLLTR